MRTRLFWAILLLAAAVLITFLFPPGLLLGAPNTDLINQFAASRAFAAENLRSGHLPLWNPYAYAGQPFLGGFQSALLYPPNAIFLCLPLDRALNLSALMHLLILSWGMHRWASRRGLHPLAAGLCGFMAPLSGAVFPHLYAGHLSNLCTLAWAPWIFADLEAWFRERKLRHLLLASAAVCLQILAGHVQYVFFTGVAAGLQALAHMAAEPSVRRRALPALAACYLLAAALAAAQLFPGFAAASEGIRQGKLPYSFATMFGFPPENLLTMVAPGFFGDLDLNQPHHSYWGRCYLWEMSVFTGVSGLLLAGVGLRDRAQRRFVRLDLVLATLLLLLALGGHTPLFRLLYDYVPGFNRFRGLSKFTFPATLFFILLVGAGADALIRNRPRKQTFPAGAMLAGLVAGGMGLLFWCQPGALAGFLSWIQKTAESYQSAEVFTDREFLIEAGTQAGRSLALAGALFLLIGASLFYAHRKPLLRWLPLAVLPMEMLWFGCTHSPTISHLSDAMPKALQAVVAAHPGDYRVLNLMLLNNVPANNGKPNNGFLLGAPDLWGNDPGVLKHYAEFIAFTQGVDPDEATQYVNFRSAPPSYALLRCRYVFVPNDKGFKVLEMPHPMPRVQLVSDCRVLHGRDAIFAALGEASFNPRRTVLLETEPEPRPEAGAQPGTVRLLETSTDSLVLEADVPRPVLLLITDLYSRDWHVRPLGGSVQDRYELLPADYILRAVPLAAGHHHLRIEYAPVSFRIGIAVSAAAGLLWLWLMATSDRKPAHAGKESNRT